VQGKNGAAGQSSTAEEVSKRTLELLESYNTKFESIQNELFNQKVLIKALSDKIMPGTATPSVQARSRLAPLEKPHRGSGQFSDNDISYMMKEAGIKDEEDEVSKQL
jgi:hypothetical protein